MLNFNTSHKTHILDGSVQNQSNGAIETTLEVRLYDCVSNCNDATGKCCNVSTLKHTVLFDAAN